LFCILRIQKIYIRKDMILFWICMFLFFIFLNKFLIIVIRKFQFTTLILNCLKILDSRWKREGRNGHRSHPGRLQNNFLLNTNIECLVREDNAVNHHHFIFNSNSFAWIKEKNTEIVQRNNLSLKNGNGLVRENRVYA
jgi:hypothetical protein